MTTETMDLVIQQIEKDFGKGSTFSLTQDLVDKGFESISSGSIGLDHILGNGGFVKGRVVEIYGGYSSGKTTVVLHTLKEALVADKEKNVAFIELESALDYKLVQNILGEEYDRILFSQPDNAENALNIMSRLTRSGNYSVIALDSVAGLTPKSEVEGDIGDVHMGKVARLISQAMRVIAPTAYKNDTLLLFVNQTRARIGRFSMPPAPTGGNALYFWTSLMLELRNAKKVTEGGDITSILSAAKVQKSKVSVPYKVANIPITFGSGISVTDEILTFAGDYSLIDKKGAWYYYGEDTMGNGRGQAVKWLEANPEIKDELVTKIKLILSTEN